MSRLEQAEALLREYVGEWNRTGGDLSPEWRNEWRDCVRDHLAAAPRSITLADELAEERALVAALRDDRIRSYANTTFFGCPGTPIEECTARATAAIDEQIAEYRAAHRTGITADAQPGDDSAEADGLMTTPGQMQQLAYEVRTQPADSAPPAEPSIAELAAHRWRIGDMFCRPECNKVRLVYALDDALALVKYIREDGVLDQCNAAILASWVQVSGCALGNLFDKLRTLDDLTQQLSDIAAKVEALSGCDFGAIDARTHRALGNQERQAAWITDLEMKVAALGVCSKCRQVLTPGDTHACHGPFAPVEALSKPQVEAGSTKLAEAYRDGWAEGYTEGMNMTAAMISFERTQPEFAQFEPLTVERIERIRDSCHVTYNGGHHDEPAHSAFHHGMDTALNVIASKLPPAPDAQAQEGQR